MKIVSTPSKITITKSKITSSKLESSRLDFDTSKISSIGSSSYKGVSVQSSQPKPSPTASSILQSLTSRKPISTSKIPVSITSSVISPSSPSSFVSPPSPSSPSPISPSPSSKSPFSPSSPSPSSPSSPSPISPSPLSRSLVRSSASPFSKGGLRVVTKTVVKKAAALPFLIQNREYQRKKNEKKQKDFLGNTRTDRFVGLINRKEILVGDKLTARQIKLDKKLTLGGRKSKRKMSYAKSKVKLF